MTLLVPRKAFDFSNWTRIPTENDCTMLKALGYTTAIVGASFNTQLARDQITVLVAHSFRIEVYAWMRHPWQQDLLDNALAACVGFPVERMWLDVEDADDATGKTPDQLAYDVQHGADYLRANFANEVSIYTGDWFWDQYMMTTNTFGCRLWLAYYVSLPPSLINIFPPPLPGGWTTLTVWQWRNNLKPGTDFNADDDIILEDDMTPADVDAAIEAKLTAEVWPKFGAVLTQLGSLGAAIVTTGNALTQHIATHPGGGATQTMAAELADMMTKIGALEADTTTLATKVKAMGAAANG